MEGARDDRVADGDFVEERQVAEERQVDEIQIVPRIDADSQRMRELGRLDIGREGAAAGFLTLLERPGERLGVQLDAIGAG